MIKLLVSAPGSGHGKTVLTCALLSALKGRGLTPCAFKCGPDYIDTMFHRAVPGVESRNLDLFLLDSGLPEAGSRRNGEDCGGVDYGGEDCGGVDYGGEDCGGVDFTRGLACTGGLNDVGGDSRESSPEARLRTLFHRWTVGHGAAVCEGAMGLFDGLGGVTDRTSAWHVARTLDMPVLLSVRAQSAALTLAAVLRGLRTFREGVRFAGVVLNCCSPSLCRTLAPALERETGLPVLGCLPPMDEAVFPSRHLGLAAPEELGDLQTCLRTLGEALEANADLDRLLDLCGEDSTDACPMADDGVGRRAGLLTPSLSGGGGREGNEKRENEKRENEKRENEKRENEKRENEKRENEKRENEKRENEKYENEKYENEKYENEKRKNEKSENLRCENLKHANGSFPPRNCPVSVRIAIARDEAFRFLYPETVETLEQQGAEIVCFSPLRDTALPPGTAGLYLPGGYPELYAAELAENGAVWSSVAASVRDGLPTVAEGGGFLYLGNALRDADGNRFPMAGVLPGEGFPAGRLVRFGYAYLCAETDSLLFREGERIPVHSFHHWDSTGNGTAFRLEKPSLPGMDGPKPSGATGRSWREGFATRTLYAGFPQVYFAGCPRLAARFLEAAARYAAQRYGGKSLSTT